MHYGQSGSWQSGEIQILVILNFGWLGQENGYKIVAFEISKLLFT